MTPLPATAVARFRVDVERLGAVPDGRLALAVSGGADSMAMLRLAAAAFPHRVVCASFDHRLRAASAAECALVANACAMLDVPHRTLTPATPIAGGSVQAQARAARYAALLGWAAGEGAALLTAHHADDQAETLLMRLNRASGLTGLAAIRAVRRDHGVTILRPLLRWRRAELRALAQDSGTPFVDDPSNVDPRHDRSRIRALLAATPGLDPLALAASAGFLAEAEQELAQRAERLWAECWRGPDVPFAVAAESRDMRRRLVRRAIGESRRRLAITRPAFGDSANVEPLLDALERGGSAVQGGVLVRAAAAGWLFFTAPPRRSL